MRRYNGYMVPRGQFAVRVLNFVRAVGSIPAKFSGEVVHSVRAFARVAMRETTYLFRRRVLLSRKHLFERIPSCGEEMRERSRMIFRPVA